MNKRTLVGASIAALTFAAVMAISVQDADAGVVAGLATEWTQVMNNIELVSQYAEQLQQAQIQLEHLEQAYQQTTALTQGIANGNFNFAMLASDLNSLNAAVQYGNGMAYTMGNLDSEFNSRYPGYGQTTGASYPGLYQNWYQTNLDTAHAALNVTGIQYSQLNNDAQLVQTLQGQSQNSTTLLQTMQVANEMAAQELTELEKLRQLMMTDLQSKATYQAQQAASAQADQDIDTNFFSVPSGGNTDTRTFPAVPNSSGSSLF